MELGDWSELPTFCLGENRFLVKFCASPFPFTRLRRSPPVPPHDSQASDETPQKKFRITRKRLGTIRFVDPKGEYGFIEAEDFREDVFFHHSVWQPNGETEGATGPLSSRVARQNPERQSSERQGGHQRGPRHGDRPAKLVPEQLVQKHVEFEIDDELFEQEKRLRATIVCPTRRPMGRKLTGRDATFKIVTHHPKARRKRPDWRG